MKSENLALSLAAALVIGIAQMFVLIYFWAYLTLYVQYVPWLVSHGITGTSLRVLLHTFDTTVNLLLCLPAAFALCALRPRSLPAYLAVAVIPGFIWQYRLFFSEPILFEDWTIFIPGALSAALTLPVAVLVARFLASRRAA
jgi:hypothetical protein